MNSLFLLLLPVAATSGWLLAHKRGQEQGHEKDISLPKDYLVGLNFLLDEQPDRALDIFIKMLEVNNDTVETHLALGSLFRRRGEVDRAIRIHQNLIARPHLKPEQRIQALLALGQDYMRAGVLDRAERIFLELIDAGENSSRSLMYLIDIYQQEKAWQSAITMANKITAADCSMHVNIAHYYCELGLIAQKQGDITLAKKHLRKALATHKNCVRASLMLGDIEFSEQAYRAAIKFYKQVELQDPTFLNECIAAMGQCYQFLNAEQEFLHYLTHCLQKYPQTALALVLAEQLKKLDDIEGALEVITGFLQGHPSIRALQGLIELQMHRKKHQDIANLQMLEQLVTRMLENKPIYRCQQCGFDAKNLHWLCPRCKTWSTMMPILGLEGDYTSLASRGA